MPSARYLASKGRQVGATVARTKLMANAEPHFLIPRCQAEVDGRQCKNVATRPGVRGVLSSVYVFCGQHYKGLPE